MRHRKTQRRLFVLQLHDRIEPIPEREFSIQPDYALTVLQGHELKCPNCGVEPECFSLNVDDDAHVVHSWKTGPVGVTRGSITRTLEAKCHACNSTISYDIDTTGKPTVTS